MPSENIQETLYETQEKLGKLDINDNSVNNLQTTMLNLETRTKTLEGSSLMQRNKDINDLQESLSFTEKKYKPT